MKNFKGFTLIELLVVISIIGVISSVIFVSFSGSRDKARLAKAQQFDADISHALGAYAVGIWRFEDISGGEVSDESGYGNNGTIQGDPVLVDSEIYPGTKALQFDGSDYIEILNNPSHLQVTGGITIVFWAYPESYHTARRNPICKAYGGEFCMTMEINSSIHLFYGTCGGNCSPYTSSSWPVGTLENNKWIHIAWTKSPDTGKAIAYANGKAVQIASCGVYCNTTASAANILIGDGYTSGFIGTLDDVRIYNEALSSAQIQQHFVAGAPAHGIAIK
jgi:prepilin-type N-terminal cleavage/methylation domain-containing protein